MIHLQDIFKTAMEYLTDGGSVTEVTEIERDKWSFETNNLNNCTIGLDIIINDIRYKVEFINKYSKIVEVSGREIPNGATWELAFFFKYGHRLEINNILETEKQVQTTNVRTFPFVWLMLDYEMKPLPNFGKDAFETNIKLAFVNRAEKNNIAATRLTENFKPILSKVYDLFFAELNKLPTKENFVVSLSKPINGNSIERYFYGSTDKSQNVFTNAQTDAIECKVDLKVVKKYECFRNIN